MMSKLSPIFWIAAIATLMACAHKPTPTADSMDSEEPNLTASVDTTIPPVESFSASPDPVFPATPDTDLVAPPVHKKKHSAGKAKKAISGVAVGHTRKKSGGGDGSRSGGSTGAAIPVAYPPTQEASATPESAAATASAPAETPAAAPAATATVEEEGSGRGWTIWIFGVIIATVGAFIYHQSHKVHKSDLLYHTH